MIRKVHVVISNTRDYEQRRGELRKLFDEFTDTLSEEEKAGAGLTEEAVAAQVEMMSSSAFRYFMMHNPADTLKRVDVPVLALFGEKDLQVLPEGNRKAVEEALKEGGNSRFTVHVLPGLNHLFQEAKTGSPLEYAAIEQTMSSRALKVILEWILDQTKPQ